MNYVEEWQTIWRAIIDCVGLWLFIRPLRRRKWLGKIERSGRSSVTTWLGKNWGELLLFGIMTAAFVYLKVSKYRFYMDMPIAVAIFFVYVMAVHRVRPLGGFYISCVAFLALDFCIAMFNCLYSHGPLLDTLLLKWIFELLYAVLLLGLCFLARHFVITDTDRERLLRSRDFPMLLLAMLPYVYVRCCDLMYDDITGATALTMELTLMLVMLATFGTVVGNRNALLAQRERMARLELEVELSERRRQYEIRRETINEVNRRYHDMVKYARMLDATAGKTELVQYLEKRMTENLTIESLQETGNGMFDTVLWEKVDRCQKENLRIVPCVDARELSFVADFDIHTIVGNALDNAIEAAAKVQEEEKREIQVRLARINRMLFFGVSNFFSGDLKEEGGELQTTKQESGPHGYGVENIRLAAERYEGTAAYEVEKDRFILTVMLPIPEKA